MNFTVDKTLFEDSDQYHDLDILLGLVEIGRHFWVVADEDQLNEIMESDWADNLRNTQGSFLAEFFSKALVANFYQEHNIDLFIKPTPNSNREYSLQHALIYLTERLKILLENITYDQHFIEALIRCFKQRGKKITNARAKLWLEYANAGGKNMIINCIQEEINRFRQAGLDPNKHMRLITIFDSDKQSPGEISPNEHIAEFCVASSVSFHMLYKREMENYLPDISFSVPPNESAQKCMTFLQLSPIQRDYYDLEIGFDPITRKENLPDLFQPITQEQFRELRRGFNTAGFNAKQSFPLFFSDLKVTQKELKNRCSHQPNPEELEEILEKISSLL